MRSMHGERGIVLPLTLIIMLILIGLVSALLALGVAEPQIAANLLAGTQAFHLAEAGMERAMGLMYTELPAPSGVGADASITIAQYTGTLFNNVALGAGTYTVTVVNNANDAATLQSVGTGRGGATRTIEAVVTTRYEFHDAILTDGDLDITGNTCVQGNLGGVHANGNLTVTGSVDIDQHATASGTFTPQGHPTIGGPTGSDQPRRTIPDLQPSAFRPAATIVLTSNGTATDGNGNPIATPSEWNFNAGQGQWSCCSGHDGTNGFYYVEGDVKISSSPNSPSNPWRVTMVTTGNLDISGNPSMAPAIDYSMTPPKPYDIQFIAGKDISMGGSPSACTNCLAGLIYAREQFNINGNVPIRGVVMALDAADTSSLVRAGRNRLTGSTCVILDSGLRVRWIKGPLRMLSWRTLTN